MCLPCPRLAFSLLNDLAELDGEIYITESFRHFQRRRIAWAALEGRPTGRLLLLAAAPAAHLGLQPRSPRVAASVA